MKEIGLEVSRVRVGQGLTSTELANKADLPIATVHKIEEGDEMVLISELCDVAKILGLRVNISFKNLKQPECKEHVWGSGSSWSCCHSHCTVCGKCAGSPYCKKGK